MDPQTLKDLKAEVLEMTATMYSGSFKSIEGNKDLEELAMQYLLEFIFGMIAIRGASEKVKWENSGIESETFNFEVERKKTTPGAGAASASVTIEKETVGVSFKVNFLTYTQAVRVLLTSSKNKRIKGKTFRQACIPFAEHAKNYLLGHPECKTAIFAKAPKSAGRAPHVAFDFAEGLNYNILKNEEKSVIQWMSARLFKTQGTIETQNAYIESQDSGREL
ncbi:coat protein [Agave virus T]|uniref:Coat protein n=1 Tax=Agave virus T TaxID=2805380 RepID=A0AAE7TSE8_9VIRU|nr:coat protein [Agave virus T]QQZ02647.1 coat protein [Agave virus T]